MESGPNIDRAARALEAELRAHGIGADRETGLGAATALVDLTRVLTLMGGFDSIPTQQNALRVNRRQVRADGAPANPTLNKPDLAYVFGSGGGQRRMNIEIDTDPKEGDRHRRVVTANDRAAQGLFLSVHPWTGEVLGGHMTREGVERPLHPTEARRLQAILAAARRGSLSSRHLQAVRSMLPVPQRPLGRPKPVRGQTATGAPKKRASTRLPTLLRARRP